MLRSAFLLISFALMSPAPSSIAQSRAEDSLMNAIDSVKRLIPFASGKNKYDLIFKVAYELFDLDNHEAVNYADQAHQLSWATGDSLEITRSGRLLGQLLRRVDLSDSSISQFNRMLPIAKRNHFLDEANRILNALGLAYSFKAVYDKALESFFKSLEIAEEQNDGRMIAVSFTNIGLVFYKMNNCEQAIEFYTKALETKTRIDDQLGLEQLLTNMSLCFTQFHDYETAREYVDKAFRVCGEDCSEETRIEGEFSLGMIFLESRQYDRAEEHFLTSYLISKNYNNKRFQAENLLYRGVVKFMKQDYQAAKKMFSETESLTRSGGYRHTLVFTYNRLVNLCVSVNDFENASLYQSKYIKLKDSVYSEDVIKNVSRLLSEYRERDSKRTVANQEKLLRLQEETIGKQKLLNVFTGIIAILFIGFTYLLYRIGQYRKQISLELDKRVQERTRELISIRDGLIRAHEERNVLLDRLSRKLNASLATIKGLGVIASRDTGSPAEEYTDKFDKIAEQLIEVVRIVQKNKTRHGEDKD